MEIPDLFEFPPGHPPSPYICPILLDPIAEFEPSAERTYEVAQLQPGLTLLAVGWLGNRVPARGPVPDEFLDRLFDAHEFEALKSRNGVPEWRKVFELRKIIPDGTAGSHACEVCTVPRDPAAPQVRWRSREAKVPGHSHHLVRLGDVVFMCPTLILHYVVDHAYQPPSPFVRAVIEGAFLALGDLATRQATGEELFREIKAEAARRKGAAANLS